MNRILQAYITGVKETEAKKQYDEEQKVAKEREQTRQKELQERVAREDEQVKHQRTIQDAQLGIQRLNLSSGLAQDYIKTGVVPEGYDISGEPQQTEYAPGKFGTIREFKHATNPELPGFKAPDPETFANMQAHAQEIKDQPKLEAQKLIAEERINKDKEIAQMRVDSAEEVAKARAEAAATLATERHNQQMEAIRLRSSLDLTNDKDLAKYKDELKNANGPSAKLTAKQRDIVAANDKAEVIANRVIGKLNKYGFEKFFQGPPGITTEIKRRFNEARESMPSAVEREEIRAGLNELELTLKEANNMGAAYSGNEQKLLRGFTPFGNQTQTPAEAAAKFKNMLEGFTNNKKIMFSATPIDGKETRPPLGNIIPPKGGK